MLWLHHGIKEEKRIPDEKVQDDADWMPVLIMDVKPGQIWFQRPISNEHYWACKLGGFQHASVAGTLEDGWESEQRFEKMEEGRKHYWAPVSSSIQACLST